MRPRTSIIVALRPGRTQAAADRRERMETIILAEARARGVRYDGSGNYVTGPRRGTRELFFVTRRRDLTVAAVRDLKADVREAEHFAYRTYFITRDYGTGAWLVNRGGRTVAAAARALVR